MTSTSSRPNSGTVWSTASLAERRVLDVAGDQQAAPAFGLDAALGLRGVLVLVEVDDRDVGALAREQHRHRAADAGVAAGDERRHALELAAALVVGRQEARLELQVGLVAGLRQVLRRQAWGCLRAGLHRLPGFALGLRPGGVALVLRALDRALLLGGGGGLAALAGLLLLRRLLLLSDGSFSIVGLLCFGCPTMATRPAGPL